MKQEIFTEGQPTSRQILTSCSATTLCAILIIALCAPQISEAGGVCVVAKKLGNSLAIEWIASAEDTVTSATAKAEAALRQQGFTKKKLQDIHIQASTALTHAHMVILKTSYKTQIGKQRTSYGCGFSDISPANAEHIASKNLSSYSWGWKPEFGYELYARHSY